MESIVVNDLSVRVTIDGSVADDVFALTIRRGLGLEGSQCSLFAPGRAWDVGAWRGKSVRVEARYSGDWVAQFMGLIDVETARTDGSGVDLSARSLLSYADSVFLGQHWSPAGGLVATYPVTARNPTDGRWYRTGWTPASIIANWFLDPPVAAQWWGGGGSLPAAWRNLLRLGDVTALAAIGTAPPPGPNGFQWRVLSLADGLEIMLGMCPNLSLRERFVVEGVDDVTYLDFIKLADAAATPKTLRVAVAGQSITDANANVLRIDREESISASKNRVIAVGARSQFVVSATTEHLTAPLEKQWLTAWGEKVIKSPDGYLPNCSKTMEPWPLPIGYAFRRYRLPECLRSPLALPQDRIPLRIGDEESVRMQVWRRGVDYEFDVEGMRMIGVPRGEPELVTGWEFDPTTGVLLLAEPNIYVSEIIYRMRPKVEQATTTWVNGVPARAEDIPEPPPDPPPTIALGQWVGKPVRDCLVCTYIFPPDPPPPFSGESDPGYPADNPSTGGTAGAGTGWPTFGVPCVEIGEGVLFGGAGSGLPFAFDATATAAIPGFTPFEPCIPTAPWAEPPDPWTEQTGELEVYVEQRYCESPLGITLCVAGSHIAYDTGPGAGLGIAPIAADGLTEAFDAPGFGFVQVTNAGFPAYDAAAVGHTFATTWLNVDGSWLVWEAPLAYQDDRTALQAYAEAAQDEVAAIRKAYEIETPYFDGTLLVGDRIAIVGQTGFDGGTHQVRQVVHRLDHDHRTTISTDNQKPLFASETLARSESFG